MENQNPFPQLSCDIRFDALNAESNDYTHIRAYARNPVCLDCYIPGTPSSPRYFALANYSLTIELNEPLTWFNG